MAKKYTADEIFEKNFKRLTGKTDYEYKKDLIKTNPSVSAKMPEPTKRSQTPSFVTPYNVDKTVGTAPEYKFTAVKPNLKIKTSRGGANPADVEKKEKAEAEYMSAVSDATKRAIADVKNRESFENILPLKPSTSLQSALDMVTRLKSTVEPDQAKILENYVEHKTTNEADREFNPESYKKIQLDASLKKPEYGTAVKNAIDNADIIDVIQAIEETGDTDRLKIVENMDGKQLKTYSYLVKNDPKAAESYFQAVTNDVKSRIAKDEYENMKVYSKYHPVGGAVGNISSSLFTPLSYVGEAINQISGNDEPLPEYSDWNRAARTVQATQQGLTEDKDPVSAFLINTGLSIGQNLVRLPIAAFGGPVGQVASLVSMASSAAGQTVYEAVQRGATGEQALLLGTVAGAIEGLTEKLPLDELLSLGKNSVKIFSKEAAKSILGQIASEGGEELVAEVSNIIADSLIMGDKSEIKQMYNSYLESGQSEKDAAINTLMQTSLNIGLAGLGGALSGGVLGGGGVVVGSVTNNLGSAKTADSVGVENLIEEGKTYGKDTNAYKLAQRAESKIKGGKNLSAYAKGQLLNENEIAKDEEIKKAKAEIEKLKKEEAAKPAAQPKSSESKNDFTFEKAEAPKASSKNIHSFETSADVRYNALGKNGKIGFDELVREADSDLDIESFARDFERAYVLGHSGLTESQVRQYMGEDYFKENSRLQAYYNGSKDATEEIEALRKSIRTKGVSLAQEGKGLVSNDISNSLNKKSFNLWDNVAKQLNVKIELVNEIDGNKYVEGKYNNGVIQIKATPDSSPIPSLMAHEITHRIKEAAPEMYKAFKTEVSTALGKDFESEFAEVAERYRMTGEKTDSEIEEELVSEYAAQLFEDESLFEEIAKRNQPLAQRLINAIKEFINKIKAAFGKGTSAEIKKLDSIQEAWAKAYDSAVKSAKTAKNAAENSTSPKNAYVKTLKDGTRVYKSDMDPNLTFDEKVDLFQDRISTVFNLGLVHLKTNVKAINPKGDRYTYKKNVKGDFKSNNDEKNVKMSALYDLADILNNATLKSWKKEESYGTNIPPKNEAHKGVKYWYKYSTNIIFDGSPATIVFNIRDKGKEQFVYLIEAHLAEKSKVNLNDTSGYNSRLAPEGSPYNNSIPNNNGRTETENAQNSEQSGKLALRKDITEMNETELREEVSRISEENKALQTFIREGAAVPTADESMSYAVKLLDKYNSSYDKAKLASHLHNRFYEFATGLDKNGNKISAEKIERNIARTANLVINEATEKDDSLYNEYSDLRKTLRDTEIKISRSDTLDFGSKEDFAEFRKHNFGRLRKMKVIDEGVGNVDSTYQMFSEEYPEFFPSDITAPSEQLEIMAGVFDVLSPKTVNVYRENMETVINEFVNDVYDYAVIYRHEHDTKNTYDIMKDERVLEWKKQREYQNKQAQKLYSKVREAGEAEIAEEIKKVKDNVKKAREIRTRNAMEKAILGAVKWLKRNKKLIGAEEALERINNEVGEIIRPLVGDLPKGKNVVETLQNFLDDYLSKNKDVYFVDAIQEYANKGISNKLSAVEKLEEIVELVQMARHDVKTAHEQFLKDRDGNYFEIAKQVISEIANAHGIKNSDKLGAELAKLQMSPYAFFRFVSGYAENSALQSLFTEMLEAEDRSLLLAREGFEQFAPLVGTSAKDQELRKKRKDFDTKKIKVKLGNRYVETTAAHIVALKLHTENEQNLAALSGGVTIPDIDKYLKGRKSESWRQGIKVIPTIDEINEAYNSLDEYSKSWRDVYKKFSDYWSKNHLNEASEKALGIKIASVNNYIHIRRDPNFLNSSFESLLKNDEGGVKIQYSGALKERQEFSNKPILLESLTDVIQDQIKLVSEYAGKIEVLTKVDKVLNAKLDNGETFKSVFSNKFGGFGKSYLYKFLSDFNGKNSGSKDGFSKLANGFRGNFAKYVLGANVTTRFVQMTAALNGAAEFGWDNFVKSLKPRKNRVKLEDIQEYTARATARESGYITTELADKISSVRLFDRAEKISEFFMEGIGKNDKVAIQSILNQAQTFVETSNPELEYGTEEYYKAIVKAFNRAVNLTQQGNTVALRPEIFRTDSELLRLFSMFSSEAVKNGNLMLDGALNLKAKQRSYRSDKNNQQKKEAYNEAKKEFANKITAVLASNMASAMLVSVLKVLFKGQWDKFLEKNEDGILTPSGEGLMNITSDFSEGIASSVVFGRFAYGVVEPVVKWIAGGSKTDTTRSIQQTLEGSIPELETVSNLIVSALNLIDKAPEAIDSYVKLLGNAGDFQEAAIAFFGINSDENIEKAQDLTDKFLISLAACFGVPAQNLKTAMLGTAESLSRGIELFDGAVGIKARYEMLKWKYSIYTTSNRHYYYDLLYEAYIEDRQTYLEIKRDLLEHGFTSEAIDNALKKRKNKK